MPGMILVCGEALIDLFVSRSAGRLTVVPVEGGSPFNLALGLGRLGCSVAFVGALSRDAFGEQLAFALERDGVSLAHAVRLGAPTTLSIVSAETGGTTGYAFHGEGCADRLMRPEQLPADLANVACVTVGSFSLAVEPSGTSYEAFAIAAAGAGRVVSLDPNIRASLIGDWNAWHQRFRRILAASTIVKASEEDVRDAFGTQASLGDLAASWRAAGPALVVITRGSEPALALGPFGALEVAAQPADVVDTVGAGDSFHAGLLAALDRRGLLDPAALATLSADSAGEVLRFAAAAAAVTCSRRGADLPRLSDLEPE